jgi:hypothetical protein
MTTQAIRAVPTQGFKGNDRALLGIVLGVVTFWLFAGTIGTIARTASRTSTVHRSTRWPSRSSAWTR